MLNPEKNWHQQLVLLPTSPVYCSHFTSGNPESYFSTALFIHTSDYLCYLRIKQTVSPLRTHTWKNVTALPCKMHNFFIWLKVCTVCCIPPDDGGSEKSWLCVGIGGSEKNRLWCVANGMSGINVTANVQSDHLLYGYMLPVIFATDQLHRLPRSADIQPMSQQDPSATRSYRGLVLYAREKMKKIKNCAFYKVVRWHFSGVVGNGVTVSFLLR